MRLFRINLLANRKVHILFCILLFGIISSMVINQTWRFFDPSRQTLMEQFSYRKMLT
jgi:hypothetical protein